MSTASNPRCFWPVFDVLYSKCGEQLFVLGILNFDDFIVGHWYEKFEGEPLIVLLCKKVTQQQTVEAKLKNIFPSLLQKVLQTGNFIKNWSLTHFARKFFCQSDCLHLMTFFEVDQNDVNPAHQ